MTDTDPYAILGVAHDASRDEVAHAYRRLAKQHHPDAGAAPSHEMARINEAWHILSDPARRARWDRGHGAAAFASPHWNATPATTYAGPVARPVARPAAPPSRMESGWLAAAAVAGVVAVVGAVMVGISFLTRPADDRVELQTAALSLLHEPDWVLAVGDGDDTAQNRVVAHLATWDTDPERLCTTYGETCGIQAAQIPPNDALILITSHEGGTPPVPQPVTARPYGLDADAMIGDAPAAFERTELEDGLTLAWWQLSPPGFPDRWIEVRALMRGAAQDESQVLGEIEGMLATLEFGD